MHKIGLALSGGGIKSIGQLPVIKALAKEGVDISYISGTSMGSVIAALFSLGLDIDELSRIVLELEQEIAAKKVFTKPSMRILPFAKDPLHGGYVDGSLLEACFANAIKPYNIDKITDVKIPLAIPAVDVITGKVIVFVSHPHLFKKLNSDWEVVSDISLASAVRASCSFPFVIAAHLVDDYHLIDGGVRMNLPLPLVQAYGAEKTIAVTLHTANADFRQFDSLMAYGIRIMDLMRIDSDREYVSRADVHINISLDGVNVFEVGKGNETLRRGELAVSLYSEQLRALNKKESLFSRLLNKRR